MCFQDMLSFFFFDFGTNSEPKTLPKYNQVGTKIHPSWNIVLSLVFGRMLNRFFIQHNMAYIAKIIKKNLCFLRKLWYSQHLMFCQVKVQLGACMALFWKGFGVQVGAKILKKSILTCIEKLIDFIIDFLLVSARS